MDYPTLMYQGNVNVNVCSRPAEELPAHPLAAQAAAAARPFGLHEAPPGLSAALGQRERPPNRAPLALGLSVIAPGRGGRGECIYILAHLYCTGLKNIDRRCFCYLYGEISLCIFSEYSVFFLIFLILVLKVGRSTSCERHLKAPLCSLKSIYFKSRVTLRYTLDRTGKKSIGSGIGVFLPHLMGNGIAKCCLVAVGPRCGPVCPASRGCDSLTPGHE